MREADRVTSISEALSLVGLTRLMEESDGDPSIRVGIIDGPLDLGHPAFAGRSLRTVRPEQLASCRDVRSAVCSHGTGVAGILCAGRGSPAPAICPSCTFLLCPLFTEAPRGNDASIPVAPADLARAIVDTVGAGVRIINLSLGVLPADTSAIPELEAACDHAARHGVILVVAAGNQGRIGFLPLLNHPWIIPVVSCDLDGGVAPESNLGMTIGARGLRAPGVAIPTAAPGGGYASISGTSAAAAIVTGAVALLWSASPRTPASEMKASILRSAGRSRRSLIPPLLDVEAARGPRRDPEHAFVGEKEIDMSDGAIQAETGRILAAGAPAVAVRQSTAGGSAVHPSPRRSRVVGQTVPCPTCDPGELRNSGPPDYVFAIGQVRMRFPSPAVEKEFAQNIAAEGGATARLTDQTVLYNALRDNRYLANEVCWVFVVDSTEAYVLVPRDNAVLDQLVEAVKPSERGLDTDVIIGTRGPMAPPEMCNGLVAPMVLIDRVFSFQKPELVDALAALRTPSDAEMTEEEFRRSADALFERVQQIADNLGATDEHRAINYLAVRYPQIYTHTAEMFARDFSLTRVDVAPSRLAGTRKLVNVVFTYTNRKSDVEEKYRARVDATEKFPFLEKRLSPYFERE